MKMSLGKFIIVHNQLPRQVARLFAREDAEWMPSSADDLSNNEWLALAIDMGDNLKVVGALSWLRNTPINQCFISGICTAAPYRRLGVARLLLLRLLILHEKSQIVIDLPRSKLAACQFFEHYAFAKTQGSFQCDGHDSVEYTYCPQSQNAPRPFKPRGQIHLPIRSSNGSSKS